MSVSELVDLNSQKSVHQWQFDVDKVWDVNKVKSNLINLETDRSTVRFQNFHSYLFADGSVITQSFSPLLKVDFCSNIKVIGENAIYHHSFEVDAEGNYWAPKHIEPKSVSIGSDNFHDDGITQITQNGTVLFEKSVVTLLDENGLGHLIYGRGTFNDDPIHLNDIQPVLTDGPFWKSGDVFLSLRHQSMVLLYRPKTNEIVWHHEGPWIHQHDVDILDDHRIAIFNNNARLKGKSNWVTQKSNSM